MDTDNKRGGSRRWVSKRSSFQKVVPCVISFTWNLLRGLSHLAVFNSLPPHGLYPPVFSVHEIFKARILEWVVISSSRGSFPPMDRIHVSWVSWIGRQILYHRATWEALLIPWPGIKLFPPALAAQSLNYWTSMEVLSLLALMLKRTSGHLNIYSLMEANKALP